MIIFASVFTFFRAGFFDKKKCLRNIPLKTCTALHRGNTSLCTWPRSSTIHYDRKYLQLIYTGRWEKKARGKLMKDHRGSNQLSITRVFGSRLRGSPLVPRREIVLKARTWNHTIALYDSRGYCVEPSNNASSFNKNIQIQSALTFPRKS